MKLLLCLIILCFVFYTNAVNININSNHRGGGGDTPMRDMFNHWVKKHSRVYKDTIEFEERFEKFKENMKKNQELNSLHGGKASFDSNKFSDLSHEEFSSFYLMKDFKTTPMELRNEITKQPKPHHSLIGDYRITGTGNLEAMYVVDWRKKGLVTPVKDQGQCGSCYAFSATEQIESTWIMAGNEAVLLSEQQVVDCDTVDSGCGGGDPYTVYQYIIGAGGQSSDADYPYTGQDGSCTNMTRAVSITGAKYITQNGDEDELIKTIANYGPVSICVDASTWQNYAGGVITTGCEQNIDHCVQVVGLDIDRTDASKPIPYYIIRNSWSESWGEKGYIRVATGSDLCGITYESTIVTL